MNDEQRLFTDSWPLIGEGELEGWGSVVTVTAAYGGFSYWAGRFGAGCRNRHLTANAQKAAIYFTRQIQVRASVRQ